jgi:hypothetical protein
VIKKVILGLMVGCVLNIQSWAGPLSGKDALVIKKFLYSVYPGKKRADFALELLSKKALNYSDAVQGAAALIGKGSATKQVGQSIVELLKSSIDELNQTAGSQGTTLAQSFQSLQASVDKLSSDPDNTGMSATLDRMQEKLMDQPASSSYPVEEGIDDLMRYVQSKFGVSGDLSLKKMIDAVDLGKLFINPETGYDEGLNAIGDKLDGTDPASGSSIQKKVDDLLILGDSKFGLTSSNLDELLHAIPVVSPSVDWAKLFINPETGYDEGLNAIGDKLDGTDPASGSSIQKKVDDLLILGDSKFGLTSSNLDELLHAIPVVSPSVDWAKLFINPETGYDEGLNAIGDKLDGTDPASGSSIQKKVDDLLILGDSKFGLTSSNLDELLNAIPVPESDIDLGLISLDPGSYVQRVAQVKNSIVTDGQVDAITLKAAQAYSNSSVWPTYVSDPFYSLKDDTRYLLDALNTLTLGLRRHDQTTLQPVLGVYSATQQRWVSIPAQTPVHNLGEFVSTCLTLSL